MSPGRACSCARTSTCRSPAARSPTTRASEPRCPRSGSSSNETPASCLPRTSAGRRASRDDDLRLSPVGRVLAGLLDRPVVTLAETTPEALPDDADRAAGEPAVRSGRGRQRPGVRGPARRPRRRLRRRCFRRGASGTRERGRPARADARQRTSGGGGSPDAARGRGARTAAARPRSAVRRDPGGRESQRQARP